MQQTSFGVSKLKRRFHRLVRVYTCQNATLLEITCRGSNYDVGTQMYQLTKKVLLSTNKIYVL